MATKAARAIFGSKRMLMYATTAMKKMISASMARSVIWEPHVGPTLAVETWLGLPSATLAMAFTTALVTFNCWVAERLLRSAVTS